MFILKEGMDFEYEHILGIYDTKEQAEEQFLAAVFNKVTDDTLYYLVVRMEKNRPYYDHGTEIVFSTSEFNVTACWHYINNVVNSAEMPRTIEGLKKMSARLDKEREEAYRAYEHEARLLGYSGKIEWM